MLIMLEQEIEERNPFVAIIRQILEKYVDNTTMAYGVKPRLLALKQLLLVFKVPTTAQ